MPNWNWTSQWLLVWPEVSPEQGVGGSDVRIPRQRWGSRGVEKGLQVILMLSRGRGVEPSLENQRWSKSVFLS